MTGLQGRHGPDPQLFYTKFYIRLVPILLVLAPADIINDFIEGSKLAGFSTIQISLLHLFAEDKMFHVKHFIFPVTISIILSNHHCCNTNFYYALLFPGLICTRVPRILPAPTQSQYIAVSV